MGMLLSDIITQILCNNMKLYYLNVYPVLNTINFKIVLNSCTRPSNPEPLLRRGIIAIYKEARLSSSKCWNDPLEIY